MLIRSQRFGPASACPRRARNILVPVVRPFFAEQAFDDSPASEQSRAETDDDAAGHDADDRARGGGADSDIKKAGEFVNADSGLVGRDTASRTLGSCYAGQCSDGVRTRRLRHCGWAAIVAVSQRQMTSSRAHWGGGARAAYIRADR